MVQKITRAALGIGWLVLENHMRRRGLNARIKERSSDQEHSLITIARETLGECGDRTMISALADMKPSERPTRPYGARRAIVFMNARCRALSEQGSKRESARHCSDRA
ncbi:MAG: hypothetical protein ACI86S_000855 [Paracoccaceae bacterium]|jgi:hypothetical protein